MNLRLALTAGLTLAAPAALFAARATSDLQPPQKRQVTVTTAERLITRTELSPLPAAIPSPFNPPDFDKPEGGPATPAAPSGPATSSAPAQPVTPPGDRDTLQILAAQITPTGVIQMADKTPRLVIGSKRFEVGTRFTATYNNQDYELELTAIDRTTFTLRYRGEEITRPIKLVR